MLRDNAAKFWESGLWRVMVTDDRSRILFRIEFRGDSATTDAKLVRLAR